MASAGKVRRRLAMRMLMGAGVHAGDAQDAAVNGREGEEEGE